MTDVHTKLQLLSSKSKECSCYLSTQSTLILLKICYCVAKVGLKPAIFLSGSPECW